MPVSIRQVPNSIQYQHVHIILYKEATSVVLRATLHTAVLTYVRTHTHIYVPSSAYSLGSDSTLSILDLETSTQTHHHITSTHHTHTHTPHTQMYICTLNYTAVQVNKILVGFSQNNIASII